MILKVHHLRKILKDLPDNTPIVFEDPHSGDFREIGSSKVLTLYTDGECYFRYPAEEEEKCLVLKQEE